MKTYSAKPSDITREWYLIDAAEVPLGRMATKISNLLTGKGKPAYTAHIDSGDFVVVINAAQLQVTGNKLADKTYHHHSGYPGSLKEPTLQQVIDRDPGKAVSSAVYGMLPKNKLRSERMGRLRVFPGADHLHTAQTPTKLSLKEDK